VGTEVTVSLLARRVAGVVETVEEGGRELTVLTEDGELMRFALSQATGTFTADGKQSGARLSFDD
jgi:hypothetical protein